jgi:hypothetical protein
MWRRRVARRGLKSHRNLLLATQSNNHREQPTFLLLDRKEEPLGRKNSTHKIQSTSFGGGTQRRGKLAQNVRAQCASAGF